MHILITGRSGYIGNSFVNYYDRKYKFSFFSLQKQSLKILNLKTIDTILHCAAFVHKKKKYEYSIYEEINAKYPINLANKAKESGVKHFVFLSTIAVYGIEEGIVDEETSCNPRTDYGKSKLKAEQELLKLQDENFQVSIVRPPIVNGYNAPGNMKSLINLIKKVPVLPFGGINNRRSMVYVGNLCYIVDAIIEQQKVGVFLASDSEPLSTTRLIELIAQALGQKVYLIQIPFFESLLKLLKPSFHKRLYGSLEVNNANTMQTLFGDAKAKLPYTTEEGIRLMIND